MSEMKRLQKACPFCGVNNWQYQSYFSGTTVYQCGECGTIADGSIINTRPIEDALRKRIAELEAERDDWRKSYINLWRHINNLPQPPEVQE